MSPTEAWLDGPIAGVPPLLQPAAHALEQVRRDLPPAVRAAGRARLWRRPGRSASIGYHAVHLAGALDRLFTYARGEPLTEEQRTGLVRERDIDAEQPDAETVAAMVESGIGRAIAQLRATSEDSLLTGRTVGRAGLPSTVLGLLFHGAEHSARHAGQVMTLLRVTEE